MESYDGSQESALIFGHNNEQLPQQILPLILKV